MAGDLVIPADIRKTATRIAGLYLGAPISIDQLYLEIADALAAEREECAKLAGADVAEAIRSRAISSTQKDAS